MPNINMGNLAPSTTFSASPFAMMLNGLLAFLSPCILPMLPVYAAYIIGNTTGSSKITKQTIIKLLGLVLGFIIVFVTLGALAGLAGSVNSKVNRNLLDVLGNIILIIFGFMMLDLIPGLNVGGVKDSSKFIGAGFLQNVLFGAVLVLSWTPCLTPLLGNALVAAASAESATALNGMYMLGFFALGLSLPMVLIMLLYQKLSGLVGFLKKHHLLIRRISGVIMIVVGILRFFIKI
ncbi:MAG: cytochrome c biogenesis protein CcdA [Christensenellaceae bacterium]|nr:cytochrome c biogenesis protein CcdA [Christensenellaceae bacterium]